MGSPAGAHRIVKEASTSPPLSAENSMGDTWVSGVHVSDTTALTYHLPKI